MPPIAPVGNSTPSLQPQTQIQGTIDPGLNANLISLATPPANFSQGKRFFITENNGNFQLTTISTGNQDLAPNANPAITGDALEIDASIAYAITTGDINPASYMAQHTAQSLRLNDAVKQVGASPLQTPSLAGEITSDKYTAQDILQFLKKKKAELKDSIAQTQVNTPVQGLISQTVLASLAQLLGEYDSKTSQINDLNTQLLAERAKASPDQKKISDLNDQINKLIPEATNAKNSATSISDFLFQHTSSYGSTNFARGLDNLHKDQLLKISKIVDHAVTKSITQQIDKALLGNNPIASPSNSTTLQTADGSVIKTPEAQAKEALMEQIQSQQFQSNLAQSIINCSGLLGLSSLSPDELKNVADSIASGVSNAVASDPSIIGGAINNADDLIKDVMGILQLEDQSQKLLSALPNHV